MTEQKWNVVLFWNYKNCGIIWTIMKTHTFIDLSMIATKRDWVKFLVQEYISSIVYITKGT